MPSLTQNVASSIDPKILLSEPHQGELLLTTGKVHTNSIDAHKNTRRTSSEMFQCSLSRQLVIDHDVFQNTSSFIGSFVSFA
jgi:hypothetical protein